MALSFSTPLKNVMINSMITSLAGTTGTAGTAGLSIYTGSPPANADAIETGTLLCAISGIGWSSGSSGSANMAAATYTGTSGTSGTAGWARIKSIAVSGTMCIDGTVGIGGTDGFGMDNTIVTADSEITVFIAAMSIP
jgi:collagen type VII alpha